MSWTVVWTERARRDLRALDRQAAARVVAALDRYAATEHGDVKRLHGVEPPAWRLRVGGYRAVLGFDYAARTLQVLRVRPRGAAYQD